MCTTRILDRDQGPSSFDFTVTAVDGVSGQTMGSLGVGIGHSPEPDKVHLTYGCMSP